MLKYPRIETLFVRDKNTFKIIPEEIRCAEFENIRNWLITEKIDGTNVRVLYTFEQEDISTHEVVDFRARTDKGELPPFLADELMKMFPQGKLEETFEGATQVCLYGEGYGERIQKGGGKYRKGVSFRLCDIWIDGWWLEWDKVTLLADKLRIQTVPNLGIIELRQAVHMVDPSKGIHEPPGTLKSAVAGAESLKVVDAEGIVARAYPMVLFRNGTPVKWKLKAKDFNGG